MFKTMIRTVFKLFNISKKVIRLLLLSVLFMLLSVMIESMIF